MIDIATEQNKADVVNIASSIGLFEPEEIPALSSMFDAYLSGELGDQHHWIIAKETGSVVGTAYYAPEMFAQNVWNVYFIGVHPDSQRHSVGGSLMKYIENNLRSQNQRMVLVETSSLPHLEKARSFYKKLNYEQEATIRDYYKSGDDKIVFRKVL
ncbi:MAG: GNAT family N-acetyltransferase [Filomicrobium sp.]